MKSIPLTIADETLVRCFRALGHPARLQILRLLAQQGTCICGELVAGLPLSQSTVSQHLKVLREAGFIQGEVEGPAVCYCLAPGALDTLKNAVIQMCEQLEPRAEATTSG